jgi:serine-type D-Ala-D-Ala carboxypeptidase (penicillin-binding protein 5/6)
MRRPSLVAASVALLIAVLALPAAGAPLMFPTRVQDGFATPGPPTVTAAAWILFDESSETVLASQLPAQERAMASTTKIMTGLLAVERTNLADVVTVSQRAADTGEREIGLVAGEQVTMSALLKAAMIYSANDAATAIAEYVGGSVEGFVDMMNERARELGLTETRFANPHGLDAPDHYSSARDLLELARVAMAYREFSDTVRARIVVFPDAPDGSQRIGTTTNLLLGDYDGMGGIKTGFTSQALLTFVATAEREGRRLYVVVLGSEGRRAHFADARALFDYGFSQLGIYGTFSTGDPYVSLKQRVEPGPLVATSNIETLIHLAGQGLMADPPATTAIEPSPIPAPVDVISRYPASSPDSLWTAFTFWWDQASGS